MEHLSSLKNQKIQQWRSLKERKGRRETGCFLVEGRKMVEEAIASRFPVEAILVDAARIEDFDLPGDLPCTPCRSMCWRPFATRRRPRASRRWCA